MRVTIKNEEPAFSDAKLFVKPPGKQKMILYGGESVTLIAQPNQIGQIAIQAGRRAGEKRE